MHNGVVPLVFTALTSQPFSMNHVAVSRFSARTASKSAVSFLDVL